MKEEKGNGKRKVNIKKGKGREAGGTEQKTEEQKKERTAVRIKRKSKRSKV